MRRRVGYTNINFQRREMNTKGNIGSYMFVLMDCFHLPDLDLPPRLSNSIQVTHLLLEGQ